MPNLGDAISLQGKPNLHEGIWSKGIDRYSQRLAAADAQKRKAKEDDDAAFKAISSKDFNINPAMYHPHYMPDVQNAVGEGFNKLVELRRQNPTNWQNMVTPIMSEMQGKLSNYKQWSGVLDQIQKDASTGKFYTPSDFIKNVNDPRYAGPEGRAKMPNDERNGAAIDPSTGAPAYDPIEKWSMSKYASEFSKDANNYNITMGKGTPADGVPGYISVSKSKTPDSTKLDAAAKYAESNPAAVRNYIHEHYDELSKEGMFDPNNTPEKKTEFSAKVAKGVRDEFMSMAGKDISMTPELKRNPFVKPPSSFDQKHTPENDKIYANDRFAVTTDPSTGNVSIKDIDKTENAVQNWSYSDNTGTHVATGSLVGVEYTDKAIISDFSRRKDGSVIYVDKDGNETGKDGKVYTQNDYESKPALALKPKMVSKEVPIKDKDGNIRAGKYPVAVFKDKEGKTFKIPYIKVREQIAGYTVDKKATKGSGFDLYNHDPGYPVNSKSDWEKLPSGVRYHLSSDPKDVIRIKS